MLRAIESPSSRKQLLCTAPRLPVVPLKQQQCCPRYLPSLDPRPALRVHRHRCFAASPMQSLQDAEDVGRGKTWDVKMLFDGECPLCMREVNMLKRRDADAGRIAFVDIASSEYQAAENAGISYEKAMGEIHAILPSGEVVKNVNVFKRLYEAVGLGWVYGFTKYEPLRKAADAVYSVWARFRLQLTGRSDLKTILAEKNAKTCRQASDM